MDKLTFRLNPRLDPASLAVAFRDRRRVHIPDFLNHDDASALRIWMAEQSIWQRAFNSGEKLFELSRSDWAALPSQKRTELENAINMAAGNGFQFRYETIRVPDEKAERAKRNWPIDRLAAFLSSQAVVAFFRQITGQPDIAFADAQATAYTSGDFLTAHDDDVAGKHRRAAYVLGLSDNWHADWGGLLMFHGHDGHIDQAFVPRFNSLNIFTVPQPHSVSAISPFAVGTRYAVTGWLRADS
jgi:Rps23 Pro-64 3,4-dihydroxylase Tpa1-like proline 4-hydroxylase